MLCREETAWKQNVTLHTKTRLIDHGNLGETGFQTVFLKGFQRASKGFLKSFQMVSKGFPKGFKRLKLGF